MDYLNIGLDVLRSAEYLGCEPVDRATWLNLNGYCAGQENGGLIKDCRDWANRKWMQIAGVEQIEVLRECALWRWNGNDLEVWAYPLEQEKKVTDKRRNMSALAGRRWKRSESEPQSATQCDTNSDTQCVPHENGERSASPEDAQRSAGSNATGNAYGNAKRKEKKGKEREYPITNQDLTVQISTTGPEPEAEQSAPESPPPHPENEAERTYRSLTDPTKMLTKAEWDAEAVAAGQRKVENERKRRQLNAQALGRPVNP